MKKTVLQHSLFKKVGAENILIDFGLTVSYKYLCHL